MTRPYLLDLRDRAIARIGAGESVRTVASALSISAATVVRWSQRYRASGSAAPGKVGGHKRPAVRTAIRARDARLLFLPPYSPDLNPIEQVFAKLKHLLRKAAERSVEATWQRIGSLLDAFPPHECANYLRNSGYGAA
ncbi:MAG: hypothetical protein EP321_05450 [Sphingomonadales bacterium]|nr:MAG: hypothetical protein EP345_17915 [Sphingomonadales bacterium]TNF04977.1 MAG: hypothetical protein EP321_05450 [Sphingomonadales bacterium]